MNEIIIYLVVAIITIIICTGYGIFYFYKLINNQKNIEVEIIKEISEVKEKCEYYSTH